MGESLKKFASTIRKKRFTIKYPDGRTESFGTCREEEDERMDVIKVMQKRDGANGIERYAQYVLAQYQLADIDYSQPEKQRTLLPEGTLIANGYYDHEHDEFVSPEVWIAQT